MTPQAPARPPRPARAVAPPSAAQAMAGVLQRMGEVLGPGAIYSLVHYGAYEEGLALGGQDRPADAEQAVQTVAAILGLEASIVAGAGGLRVQIKPAPHVSLESRGTMALAVGLLEGLLTAARGSKVQAAADPATGPAGELEIEFDGGAA
jgi:hypothetical protein